MAYVPKYISKTIGKGGKPVYRYSASGIPLRNASTTRGATRKFGQRSAAIHSGRLPNMIRTTAAQHEFLGNYHAWSARRGFAPAGNNPLTGDPYAKYHSTSRALGKASNMALARVHYGIARGFPKNPMFG